MKTKHIITALLVLAGGAIGVHAGAGTVTSGLNDIIVGFYATGGTGATTNLEVDLGNASQFYGVGGTLTLAGLNSDLSSTYGATWNTRTDLFWGVAGTTGSATGTTIGGNAIAAKTLWAGSAQLTLGSGSTPWNKAGAFAQQAPANTIATLYANASGSLNGAAALTDNAHGALINNTLAGSWTKQEGTSAAAFNYFNPKGSFDNSTNIAGGSFAATDLYELQPGSGPGSYLGTFALSSGGNLTYGGSLGAATIPEPSTYAAIFGAMTLGFVAWRRRNQSAKA